MSYPARRTVFARWTYILAAMTATGLHARSFDVTWVALTMTITCWLLYERETER